MGTGAGAGIGSLLGLLSDRRLKTDIKQVGTLDNGLPVYTFKYKNGDGTTVMGVMADEVKEIFPELVGTTEDGFDFVYYGGCDMGIGNGNTQQANPSFWGTSFDDPKTLGLLGNGGWFA